MTIMRDRRAPPTPQAIERMMEMMRWGSGSRKISAIWSGCGPGTTSVHVIGKRFGCDRTTAWAGTGSGDGEHLAKTQRNVTSTQQMC